jgi:hypothetical protein
MAGFLGRHCRYEQLRQSFLLLAKNGKGTVGVFENRRNSTGKATVSWRQLDKFIILDDRSDKQGVFEILESNESDDNETSNNSDSLCLAQLLWTSLHAFCFGHSICKPPINPTPRPYLRVLWIRTLLYPGSHGRR